jgi:hypothetical protein
MATKNDRLEERRSRESDRRLRQDKRTFNQRQADMETYGEDSLLFKDKYMSEGVVQDVSTTAPSQYVRNKTDYESDSNQRGEDRFVPEYFIPDSTSQELGGIEILWADNTYTYILASDIFASYDGEDYWSIAFDVTNNEFDKTYMFDSTEAQWNDTGTSQTVYRLRVITQNEDAKAVANALYGQYRESIICRNGEPVTALTKSS